VARSDVFAAAKLGIFVVIFVVAEPGIFALKRAALVIPACFRHIAANRQE
jgi:hypothetical protein